MEERNGLEPRSVAANDHVPELDGIRAVAIVLVMLRHFEYPAAIGPLGKALATLMLSGWMGVNLFFILSGYLITGICLDRRGPGFFRSFYVRRALRILPAYVVFLVVSLIGAIVVRGRLPTAFVSMLTFTTNVWVSRRNDLLAIGPAAAHLWSLAVEEQSYFIWPAIVVLGGRRIALSSAVLAVPAAFCIRALLIQHRSYVGAITLTPAQMDTFALGGVLAFVVRSSLWDVIRDIAGRWVAQTSWLAVTALIAAVAIAGPSVPDSRSAASPLVWSARYEAIAALLSLVLAATIALSGRGFMSRALRARAVRWVGRRSYAIYLFHVPVAISLYREGTPSLSSVLGRIAFGGTASCVLAALSWRAVEAPALALKRMAPYPRVEPITLGNPREATDLLRI